jgi:hypothetical protein
VWCFYCSPYHILLWITIVQFLKNFNLILNYFFFAQLGHFETQSEFNCIILVRDGLIERKIIEVKQVADWKFKSKFNLSPLSFLSIRWFVSWILQNSILVPNFILLIFWLEEREEVIGFMYKRENVYWWGILPLKRSFLCKMVSYDERS